MRKLCVYAGLLALAVLIMLPIGARQAPALQESYLFEGSGWGHGVGMCQRGAYGMAKNGFSCEQILTYYYQGTNLSAWACPETIRVGLLEGESSIQLAAQSGSFVLFTSDGDTPGGVIVPGGTWTVTQTGDGHFMVLRPDGTPLNDHGYGGLNKPLYIRGSDDGDAMRLPQNGNRGVSHLSFANPLELNIYGISYPFGMRAILNSDFETYLRGIAEVFASWPQAAVRAQAVAARSYAVCSMGKHASSNFDLCDETHCQYYKGYDQEMEDGWVQAVDATSGQVLTYAGQVAHCFYCDSCGGHTDNNEDVWGGSPIPYLRGVPDPYCMTDDNPRSYWTVTYTRAEMEAMLNAHTSSYVGTLYSMDLSNRTPSGRVRTAAFTGSAGTKRISGELMRGFLNLRSAMVNTPADNFDEYILLANPSGDEVSARVEMHAASGREREVEVYLQPMSRQTVHVDEYLPNDDVSTYVHGDGGIIAERAMYFDYMGMYSGGSCEHGADAPRTQWYLAEGYTAQGFDTWILVYNPGGESAHVTMDLLREDGYRGVVEMDVAAATRHTVSLDSLRGFESCSLSAKVNSDKPVVVERSMYFDSQGRRGGHVSLGTPLLSRSWYFAEGYTSGGFDTWLLIGNPSDLTAKVEFHLQVPGGGSETMVETSVAPHSRYTLHVDDYLAGSEVSAFIQSDQRVVAERAIYFDYYGKDDGSCVLGTAATHAKWFLAEGYTGGDFDEYVLVGNPGDDAAQVKFSFLTQGGLAAETFADLAPRSRYTIHVDDFIPSGDVSLVVEEMTGKGIVAERAMYFDYFGRRGGHAALGVPLPSTIWFFAEGYTGG